MKEKATNKPKFIVCTSLTFALFLALPGGYPVQAQDDKTLYPTMASDQYLMDRDAEIALARSAAPESISHEATVMVLGRHGYEVAVQGKNGFVCDVERAFVGPFDNPEFWNPKQRGAIVTTRRPSVPLCRRPLALQAGFGGFAQRTNP